MTSFICYLLAATQPPATNHVQFFSTTDIDAAASHLVFLRQAKDHLRGQLVASGNTVDIDEKINRFSELPKSYVGLSVTWLIKVSSVSNEGVIFPSNYGTPGGWTTKVRLMKFKDSAPITFPLNDEWMKKLKRGEMVKLTATIAGCTVDEIVLDDAKIFKYSPPATPAGRGKKN